MNVGSKIYHHKHGLFGTVTHLYKDIDGDVATVQWEGNYYMPNPSYYVDALSCILEPNDVLKSML